MPTASEKSPLIKKLSSLFSKLRLQGFESVLAFTHRQADPDALCSAYALSELITRSKKISSSSASTDKVESSRYKIIAPQGASQLAASVCEALSIKYQEEISDEEINNADLILCVDVGEKELLEPYLEQIVKSKATKVLVDHHSSSGFEEKLAKNVPVAKVFNYSYVDSKATSTCEIAASVYPETLLDQKMAKVLLVGLLFDSQHLGIATENTLRAALKLVSKGVVISEAKELLRSKPERSETIARLKAAQRLKFYELGPNYLVAEAEVSSFQAPVARMLVDLGADVSLAYGNHEGDTRISLRSTQRFERETGIDLGSVLSKISEGKGLTGGGHRTAASISGNIQPKDLKDEIVSEIKNRLPKS